MSLKSFDKFCENLILSEPGSQKEIIDERQKMVRSKALTEALIIYGAASFVNTVIMDRVYQWCDNFFGPMVLFAAMCYIYWILRSHFGGALFGVNGTFAAKCSAVLVIIQAICWCFMTVSDFAEGEALLVHEGMLTVELICGISFVLFFVSAVAVLIFAKKTEKVERTDEKEKG